eukprot:gene7518-8315_t
MRLIVFFLFIILSFLYSNGCDCDEYDVDENDEQPCGNEIRLLCDLTASPVVADAFDQKTCLLRNYHLVSSECAFYLARNPSVVDSCMEDIQSLCGTVEPGERRILDCFMQQDSSLFSEECRLAMKNKSLSNEGYYLRPMPAEINTDDPYSMDMDMDTDSASLVKQGTENEFSISNIDIDSLSTEEETEEIDEDTEASYYLGLGEAIMLRVTYQLKELEIVLSRYVNALMKYPQNYSENVSKPLQVLQHLRGFSLE